MALRRACPAIVVALCLIGAQPAWAHSSFGTMGPFWSGALHVMVSPLSLVNLVGLGAALAAIEYDIAGRSGLLAIACSMVATLAGASLYWLGPLGAIVLGLAAAAGARPTRNLAMAMGAFGGMVAGASARVDAPDVLAALGAGFAVFFALLAPLIAFEELEKRLPLARRVVGAWIAAIGLLLGALALRH